MSQTVISVENLYKEYKLGVISHGTLHRDMQSWWARVRGKEDPNSLISAHHSTEANEGSFLALNDVSFEVKEGEILGIIGKNGAGKSTLLKILSRITAPTSGQIKIKGRVGSLLEVGTGFHPELTGRENIYLNGAILGMKKWEINTKIDEIIDFAGIERHIDTPVKRYSSGMHVRLAFSVAAHLDPEILVVDEVLAVGDATFQEKCLGKMKDISEGQGRTILFVSHNMAAVRKLCTRGILLDKGCIQIDNQVDKTLSKYLESTIKSNLTKSIPFQSDIGYLRVLDFNILKNNSELKINIINKTDEVYLLIKIEIIEKINDLTLGYSIFNENHEYIYRSLSSDTKDDVIYGKGQYIMKSKIPINVLTEGTYRIVLDGGIYKKSWDFNPLINNNVQIFFKLIDKYEVSKYWNNKRAGLIAPIIEWEVQKNG